MRLTDLQEKLKNPLSWQEWCDLTEWRCEPADKGLIEYKKGFGKNCGDEIFPLAEFIKLRYPSNTSLMFRYVDGNQSYDMLVLDGEREVNRIEITRLIDRHSAHKSMQDLNANGITMKPPVNYKQTGVKEKLLQAILKKQRLFQL